MSKDPSLGGDAPPPLSDKQMELLEVMQKILQEQNRMGKMLQMQNEKFESMSRETQDLREEVSYLKVNISRLQGYPQRSPAPRMLSDQHSSIPLQLKFLNSCKNDKFSKKQIEADDKAPLKVAIYNHNNKIITSEPFSSMRVHIVPIQGDFDDDHKGQWTEEYFRSKIVTGRRGKVPLLYGDLYIRLQNGVGYLNTAKFQDNSSFVASKKFKLGVMAVDERISQRIQEGITESFAVKDIRGLSTKKNPNPSPRDPIYKLSKIAKDGDRHKSLEKKGIRTVWDFLLSYTQSPENLRNNMGKISDQDWDVIINNAQKCQRPGNHEHETISRGDGSCHLQGSSSMQPGPATQKQLDVQVMHQQSSSTYNELVDVPISFAPSLSVYGTMEGCSSEQQRSSQHNIMHDDFQRKLSEMGETLMSNDTDFLENIFSGGSYNASEQIKGSLPASEASSCGSQMEFSRSLVSRPGSRSSRGPSFSQMCPVCLSKPLDMALGCGHQTCSECGEQLPDCPICRSPIVTRLTLQYPSR